MRRMGRAMRFAIACVVALLCAGRARPQETPYEFVVSQAESGAMASSHVFSGRTDGVTIESRRRILSCCLEYAPVVEVAGGVVRITEGDVGPNCECEDVPWDLRVEILGLPPADYDIFVAEKGGALIASARVTVPATETALFVRGRVNDDATVDISDAVAALDHLFLGGEGPACLDAADIDDDGARDISDPIYLLAYLFGGGPAPEAPYPEAGEDPTPDSTVCSLENSVTAADFVFSGDIDRSGTVDITDGVFLLNYIALGGSPPVCADAVDGNDDGEVDLLDLCFVCPLCCGWWPPLAPGPPQECGPDPTPDRLGCELSNCRAEDG